jgi:hypothetical protein
MCKHPKKTIQETTRCFRGPVNEAHREPRADGNVCYEERCALCGAERWTNVNQRWSETTGWFVGNAPE